MTAIEPVYDSARRLSFGETVRIGLGYRNLVGLLTLREVSARYERTALGLAWTLVTPLAYAAALWAVFSEVARFATPGVPFEVYVLSGVIVFNFVSTGVLAAAGAVMHNTAALRRTAVPVGVFLVARTAAALVTLLITTLALLVVQVLAGAGIPATALALPLIALPLAVAIASFGLLAGTLGAIVVDAIEVVRVALTLAGFVTPIFYPLSIVPEQWRWVVEANPIYPFLVAFRDLAYGGSAPPAWAVLGCLGWTGGFFVLGSWTFVRVRRALPTLL